ncbi:hypothetical protein PF003_g24938 [Phytophthora fragariae]|nr:hypothetical protein PF003_g24938 [Phytophthora fragariae]
MDAVQMMKPATKPATQRVSAVEHTTNLSTQAVHHATWLLPVPMLIQGVVALSVGIVLPSYALGKKPVLIFQPLADQVMFLSVELAEQIASLSGGLNAWIGV